MSNASIVVVPRGPPASSSLAEDVARSRWLTFRFIVKASPCTWREAKRISLVRAPMCQCMQRAERCVRCVRCARGSTQRRSLEVQSFDAWAGGIVPGQTCVQARGGKGRRELGGDWKGHASRERRDDPAVHPARDGV